MKELLSQIFVTTLYFLALINPISKVSVLTVLSSEHEREDFAIVTKKASLIAGVILLSTIFFGEFILRNVFRVELHSLKVAGGAVLCWVGFNALRKGVFFEQEVHSQFADIALVPLACPMIAGPATIAACVSLHESVGILIPGLSVIIAIALNHVVMRFSRHISNMLGKYNLLGALVRLTGLVVMTIGTQMVFDGVSAWLLNSLHP